MAKREQKTRDRVYDLVLKSMNQIDVSAAPICLTLELSQSKIEEILLLFRANCFLCVAIDASDAAVKLSSSATRRAARIGESISYFRGSPKIWTKSSDGNAFASGIDKEVYEQSSDL